MGLTRSVPATSGYSELHTYGCRKCGVWVTEGSPPRDQLKDTSVVRKWPFSVVAAVFVVFSVIHLCPLFAVFDPTIIGRGR